MIEKFITVGIIFQIKLNLPNLIGTRWAKNFARPDYISLLLKIIKRKELAKLLIFPSRKNATCTKVIRLMGGRLSRRELFFVSKFYV